MLLSALIPRLGPLAPSGTAKLGMTPEEAEVFKWTAYRILSLSSSGTLCLSPCHRASGPPLQTTVSLCLSGALHHVKEPLHPLRSRGGLGIDVTLKGLVTGPLGILVLPDSSWCR